WTSEDAMAEVLREAGSQGAEPASNTPTHSTEAGRGKITVEGVRAHRDGGQVNALTHVFFIHGAPHAIDRDGFARVCVSLGHGSCNLSGDGASLVAGHHRLVLHGHVAVVGIVCRAQVLPPYWAPVGIRSPGRVLAIYGCVAGRPGGAGGAVNVERSLMAIGWQVPANWWTRDHNLCIAISWITVARALRVDYRKVETQGPVKPTGLDLELRGRQSVEVKSYQVRCTAYLLCFSSKTRTTTAALTNCDHFVCLEVNHQLSAKMVVQSELNSSTEQFDPIILAAVPIKVFPQGMFGNTVIDRDRLSRISSRKLISPSLNPCLPKTSPLTTISSCLSEDSILGRTHYVLVNRYPSLT
ncbi:hypothetical protein THAOC_29774, partial [Thalassiosira oceanica]